MPIQLPEKVSAEMRKLSGQFQDLIQPLKELVSKQANSWLVGAIGVVVLLDVLLILMPLVSSFFSTSTRTSVMRNEIEEVKKDKFSEASLKSTLESTGASLKVREARLATGDISVYLEALSEIASEAGVHIELIQPLEAREGAEDKDQKKSRMLYEPAYFKIRAVAGYHEIGKFVSQIESYPTFIQIIEMAIRGQEGTPRSHLVAMQIEMIRKNDDDGLKKKTKAV